MNYQYNVKAIITNISDRIIFSGFKPTHNIKGYLTTGIHKYIDKDAIRIAESSIGFIAFITPELYIDNINELLDQIDKKEVNDTLNFLNN